jgi:hypothetical protein
VGFKESYRGTVAEIDHYFVVDSVNLAPIVTSLDSPDADDVRYSVGPDLSFAATVPLVHREPVVFQIKNSRLDKAMLQKAEAHNNHKQ